MSEKTLIDAVRHYQKDIERCPDNKERMLRCIKRLYVMPIKVEHLQVTGVGRSVNNLREIAGDVGDAATALVAKWKAMVTAEDAGNQSEDDESAMEEEVEELEVQADNSKLSNGRITPDKFEDEHSIREKENIRVNHRTEKLKTDKPDKSEKSSKHSDKHSKDNKSSKHSSKDKDRNRDSSTKNDRESSSKNHSSNSVTSSKDRKDKHDKHGKSSSSKVDHKINSDKEKIKSKDESRHHSKDKPSEKHSSKDKEHLSSKDRHSSGKHGSKDTHKNHSSSPKDKKDKDKYKDSKDKHEKRLSSSEREKDMKKSEKRKHRSKDRDETPAKRMKNIKQEKLSSDEEEGTRSEESMEESDGGDTTNENTRSESENNNDSENSDNDHSGLEQSDSERSGDESEPDYKAVRIKQEPLSDSGSEKKSRTKSSSHSHHRESSHKSGESSSSKRKESRSDEMKPPSSTRSSSDLKALIKENEKKIKKEKTDDDKTKKSKVKIEMNQDGSIDSGSGASFADALMGFDSTPTAGSSKKKKKKDRTSGEGSSRMSSASSMSGSQLSGRSRSPSVCSTVSNLSVSPIKKEKKHPSLETPDALLQRPMKLEPLSLDISSTLPEISTNYKPLPSINQSRHTPTTIMSEEQMFTHMATKTQRTKVYSGYKYGHTLSVPSLYTFCIQVLYDNIDGLEYTGGVPFEILKPLLTKLNADQLLNLEHYNTYLVSDTDDLWKFHCTKTFPKAKRDDYETWRETYLRCMDERELKLKRLTANISESMAKSGPARQAKLAYVDSVAKPPRNVARKQAKYGTGASTSSSSVPSTSSSSPNISQIAAAQNQAKKKEIVSKAIVGGFTPAAQATEQVPGFNNPAAAAKILKKKKAPLMAKALQLIKSNSRYKR